MSLNSVLIASATWLASDEQNPRVKVCLREILIWEDRNVKGLKTGSPCSPANFTSAGISGDLELPFYITDHYFCTACLGEMAPGKIDNSNFLSSFAPSRAWSLTWHSSSRPENAVDVEDLVDLYYWIWSFFQNWTSFCVHNKRKRNNHHWWEIS